jgi:hypothetical protein
MNEKKITFRLNMDKYFHRLAYDIYMSIPGSQRSDYIRLAIILMHDRDEQARHMKSILAQNSSLTGKENSNSETENLSKEMPESAKNMLGFISRLNTQ